MAKKEHVSETPATQLLKAHKVDYTEHPYEYLEHGGAQHSAQVLGWRLVPFPERKFTHGQERTRFRNPCHPAAQGAQGGLHRAPL
jgi:Uncharacterized conserved protein